MARICGVNLPANAHVVIGLTGIYGIGKTRALKVCSELNIEPTIKCKDLSDDETKNIQEYINKNFQVEGDLRRYRRMRVKSKIDMRSYEGMRHLRRLPVRGQNTKNNSRTVRRGEGRGGKAA